MPLIDVDNQKRAAAEAAAAEIEDGMLVGLGTGSTVTYAIEALARRCREGLRIETVATSHRSGAAAETAGIPVIAFDRIDRVDVAIDGVDEIDGAFNAIKGAGGAMLREKIVASAADRMIAIADFSKKVGQLGTAPVPVEVLPFARQFATRSLLEAGAQPQLRLNQDGLYRTDQGNIVIDCAFGLIEDPAGLAAQLAAIPGVLGHGLFIDEIDRLYLGTTDGVIKSDKGRGNETI